MSLSDAWENLVLDAMLGDNHSVVFPGTVYVGLSTTAPNDDGTNFTEPSDGAYGRVAVTNDSAYWPDASGSQKRNGLVIVFPTAGVDWGDVGWVGVFGSGSGGVPGITGALGSVVPIIAGQSPDFPPNALVLTAD